MAEVLKRFKKNSSEEIWVAITDYKERELLDLRVYYRPIDDAEMKPTKRGVSLALSKAPDLLAALEKINADSPLNEPAAQMEKSDTETVQVALKEFKGHRLVDIRTYFRPQGSQDLMPSQKGVAFKFSMLDEVRDVVRQAVAKSKPRPDEKDA